MYVCICRIVTQDQVESLIEAGARTVEDVTRECRAGDDCGACRGAIEGMIEESTSRALPRPLELEERSTSRALPRPLERGGAARRLVL